MAGRMKTVRVIIATAALAAALPGIDTAAQIINDPTRPPAGIYLPDTASGTVTAGPVLQSVMITPTERSAIIGGERIKLGDKYGEARVVGITENEVVLRSASGSETLSMYPGISMKRVERTPPAALKPVKKRRVGPNNAQGKQG